MHKKISIRLCRLQETLLAILFCCMAADLAAADENVICSREPVVVAGVKGQALNFVTSDPGMFDWSSRSMLPNAPRPFLCGQSGTIALWFKGEYLSKDHSVLLELGTHRDGLFTDWDGIMPAKGDWPGETLTLAIQPKKAPGDGHVAFWGSAGGTDFGITSSNTMDLKSWHHAAVVWQPGNIKLFVDGKLAGSAAVKSNDFELASYFHLAGSLWGGNAFNGALDEIMILSRSLTPEEITALAQKKDFTGDAALSFYMPCDGSAVAKVERRDLESVLAGKTVFRAALGKFRFSPVGDPIRMKLSLPQGPADEELTADLSIKSEDGRTVFQTSERLHRDPSKTVEKNFSATVERCGIYWLSFALKGADGKTIFARSAKFGVIAKLPPLSEIPDTSPCGFWPDTARTQLGTKWIRLWDASAFSWTAFEPQKGRFHWDYLNAFLEDVKTCGAKPLLCITGTPRWASSMSKQELDSLKKTNAEGYSVIPGAGWAGTAAYPPSKISDFESFLRELFKRYKGKITAYECWNEPDTTHFKGSAEQYVEMLKTMYRVLKEEDPGAILVGGVGSGYPPWNTKIFGMGAGSSMDALSIHPYCMFDPILDYHKGSLGQFASFIKEKEKELGHPLPVWADELGIVNSPLGKEEFIKKYGAETTPAEGVLATYKEQSIRWDITMQLALLAMGNDNKVFPGGTNNARYDDKSLAFAAFAKVASFRKTARFFTVNDQSLGVMLECEGRKDDPKRIAAFCGAGSVVFPLDAPQVKGMDMYGNPVEFKTEDGLLKMTLSADVTYLFDVPANFAGIQVVSIKLPKDSKARQAVTGELIISNPYRHQETFRLEAKSPEGWKIEMEKVTATLEPGAKLIVPMTIQSGTSTGDVEMGFTATDTKGNVFASRHTMFNLAIVPMAKLAAPIDPGKESSWKDLPVLATVDSIRNVNLGQPKPDFPDMPHWLGPKDLSYQIRGGWREDGIYLWIDVTDDKLHPGKASDSPWNMDAVELFIDLLNGKTLTGARTDTEQIAVVPSLGREFAPCELRFCDAGTGAKVQFFGKKTERGYIVAGRIFYRSYSKLRPDLWVGFDVKVDDCDDPAAKETRKASMTWNGDEENTGRTSRWGRFVLTKGAAGDQPGSLIAAADEFKPLLQKVLVNGQTLYEAGSKDGVKTIDVDASAMVNLQCTFVNKGSAPGEDPFRVFVIINENWKQVSGADYTPSTPATKWEKDKPVVDTTSTDLSTLKGKTLDVLIGLYGRQDRFSLINEGQDNEQRLPIGKLNIK
ncbi:MAG TPA: hypothetical protein DCZ94_03215 [Lentisphaeria bacterium]|nr:MAG: hypothetical protein A2X48_03395 [Lentisphaerae bacterium GWF2_49_21]HBC85944.1 hypothetical protein [Lentisphaeria bacterium]